MLVCSNLWLLLFPLLTLTSKLNSWWHQLISQLQQILKRRHHVNWLHKTCMAKIYTSSKITSTRWTWGGEQSCRWSGTDRRIDNWQNCCKQAKSECPSRNSFWMLVKAITLIFPWLASKSSVAEVYTVQRNNRGGQNASTYLKTQ